MGNERSKEEVDSDDGDINQDDIDESSNTVVNLPRNYPSDTQIKELPPLIIKNEDMLQQSASMMQLSSRGIIGY